MKLDRYLVGDDKGRRPTELLLTPPPLGCAIALPNLYVCFEYPRRSGWRRENWGGVGVKNAHPRHPNSCSGQISLKRQRRLRVH